VDNRARAGQDTLVEVLPDSVLRAVSNDGAFRVITARTTATVRGAVEAQKATGGTIAPFGDLITGTVLMRETMSPQLRVQGIVKGAGHRGTLVADSHPGGATRGLVQLPRDQQELHIAGGHLQMMRTLHDGRVQQGVVEIPSPSGSISEGVMRYMQDSEQITCVMSVGTLVHGDRVLEAGGYIVQLLPEVDENMLAVMTMRLSEFPSIETLLIEGQFSPRTLMDELLYRMPYTQTDESDVRFECNCSHVRVISSLATLRQEDIQGLINDGGMLQISCDFCGKDYEVAPEQLKGLLRAN